MAKITKVRKRDGRIVPFQQEKITEAIWKAAQNIGGTDHGTAEKIASQVTAVLEVFYKDEQNIPSVEQIQDLVEKILIENGHAKTAKEFILYRQKDKEIRQQKEEILGIKSDTALSVNALKILKQRYLLRDNEGNVTETPEEMFRRVAHNIAEADKLYSGYKSEESEETFYRMMSELDFLPNSPTLMNAGTSIQQLAACFVLPVEDSIPGIFDSLKKSAIIQQSGGGTGFNFSKLRPRGDIVHTTKGVSSGPVSFMKVFDTLTSTMKEGGKRRGANMGILNVDHPDIIEFISSKEREGIMENFNISIGLNDKFMEAVEKNEYYSLINPRTGNEVNKLNAKGVFDLIVTKAWENGEPGIIFLDRIEESNPTPGIGEIMATNPCGEQPLLPYEACNLGSINLSRFLKEDQIDWDRLRTTIYHAVHFLDNVIDVSDYKLDEIKNIVLGNRKIGLGVMGFADLLYQMRIPYNSLEGLDLAEKIMSFIQKEAKEASIDLAEQRGSFPNFEQSIYPLHGFKAMRNATVTTIAPAGTLSMIAETSAGIEPVYAIAYTKHVFNSTELTYINKTFKNECEKLHIYSDDLIRRISKYGSIQKIMEIPGDMKKYFVVASDIAPEWHVRMQAAFQKYVDNAVSKTINLPEAVNIEDVRNTFILAYKLGCKGITVYRDRSRKKQVLYKPELTPLEEKPSQTSATIKQSQLSLFKKETKKAVIGFKGEEVTPPPIINSSN
ncbi:MAG TPA: adenosylcobalamin-dependent ribonucleoside-diphosphate reductase [Candidatus Gracilibacteria bacterium]|nr:adenosylcobalamin-dependent ribonucleoside-diphosphate reductase [Candidatus Gracilibacteria bacterium]